MGDAALPGQGRGQRERAGVHLVAGVETVGDNAGPDHLTGVVKVHDTGGVVQVADGNLYSPLPEHIVKAVEKLCLAFCPGQIGTVRRGKVGEEPLCFYAGQGGNAGALVCGGSSGLEADAAHAGIQGKVKRHFCEPGVLGGLG